MATVAEILKASGMTDEQIAALDAKVVTGFTTVLSTAEKDHADAEEKRRITRQNYDEDVAPALTKWAQEKADLETKMAAYHAALKAAKENGFEVPKLIMDAPVVETPGSPIRNADGTFRPAGSPAPADDQIRKLRDDMGGAFAFLADTSWRYRNLFGTELPDAPTVIIREATAARMNPAEYAAKKYDFAGKEKEKREAASKAHDDAIRKEVAEQKDKEWSEKVGNNPNVRQAEVSSFSEVRKAVKEGTRPDPLKLTPTERAAATRQAIRKDIAERNTGSVQ